MSRRLLLPAALVGILLLAVTPAGTHAFNPPLVAIQAGHWHAEQHAPEFSWLRNSTGAEAAGVREVDRNVDISFRIAEYLRSWGNQAYVLPASVPPHYHADAFVAIHSDGNDDPGARGYKVATSYRDWIASSTLVHELEDEYGRDTGLPKDWRITENMRDYYAFQSGLYEHTIAEDVPEAIIEMGFITNRADRRYLLANRDAVARATALGIARFLGDRPAGSWPAPPARPSGDVVEVLHNRVPLYSGPGTEFHIADRTSMNAHYAVSERRGDWAKLFYYDGSERWIQDFQTRRISVP